MALSLRDLLDKQRAEREAREMGVAPSVQAVPKPQQPPQEAPPTGHTEAAPSTPSPTTPIKRGMFSTLAGASATNVAQTETARPQTQVAAETVPQVGSQPSTARDSSAHGSSGNAVGSGNADGPAQNGQVGVAPGPALSVDETETLRKNLAFLAANLDEKEIVGQVLRTTVRQIQQHPELNAIMIDSDFDLIVAAARRSMKFVARKKEEKADVKATKKSKKDELDAWLKDQGIDLG